MTLWLRYAAPLRALVLLLAGGLLLAAVPAHAQEANGQESATTPQSQWDALGDPDFGGKVMKRRGWFFAGALGMIYVANDKNEFDGYELGSAGFSGNAQIGGFIVEDRLSLAFLFHGMTGPRQGDRAFSILNFMGRSDFYVWDFNDTNHLYLIGGAGLSEIGTFPEQVPVGAPPGVTKGSRYETSLTYGVGVTLKRFNYVQTSAEFMGMQVLTGPDKAHVFGLYLSAWFTTDAGLFE